MCPVCWELRARKVEPQQQSKARLQNLGLGFGIASVLPLWPLILASFVLNIVAIVKARDPALREHRWKPIVGLCLTVACIAVWAVIITAAVTH